MKVKKNEAKTSDGKWPTENVRGKMVVRKRPGKHGRQKIAGRKCPTENGQQIGRQETSDKMVARYLRGSGIENPSNGALRNRSGKLIGSAKNKKVCVSLNEGL